MTRYLHTLADFDLKLRHIPGSTNKADALSQRPDHDDGSQDNEEVVALSDSLFARALVAGKEDRQILDKQKENKDAWEEWKCLHSCEEKEGALYKRDALAVMGGGEAYKDLLKRYHDGTTAGHPGVWKTWQALQQDYWWPMMKAFVKEYVAGCAVCQQMKTITRQNQPPLQPITLEECPLPFATMSVDFVVKLPESKGNNTILTITDQGCTKVVILVPCRKDMGAKAIWNYSKNKSFPIQGSLCNLSPIVTQDSPPHGSKSCVVY